MKIDQLNHISLHATDLEASTAFYRDVLGLELMDRPAFDFEGAWFRVGKDQELHLILWARDEPFSIPHERHLALRVTDIEEAKANLEAKKIDFSGPKKRPDGVPQIFLQDPDGHVLELAQMQGLS